MPENNQKGNLSVNVTTLRGSYPVKGAQVVVFVGENSGENQKIKVFTDESGKTPLIVLGAKDKELSEAAGNGIPYITYNIYTVADGFIPQYNMNIPIFSGVTSLQNVDLTPLSAEGTDPSPITIEEAPKFTL